MMPALLPHDDPQSAHVRRLAKILRVLLDGETFTNYADLKDAFARRLAGYRLACDPDDLAAAFALVESNRPLTSPAPVPLAPLPPPPPAPPSTAEARAILEHLQAGPRPMPATIGDASSVARVRAQADQMRGQGAPRVQREPLPTRLARIFAGEL